MERLTNANHDAIAEKLCREKKDENPPLTLDELREMDGEPVWGAFLAGRDCYMIIQWHNCEFFKSYECGFLLAEEYGKTWFAYRRRPEGQKDLGGET